MTTEQLIAIVRRQASIPISQVTYLDSDIIDTANGEMQTYILPFMDRIKSDFFLWNDDYSYMPASRYRIHTRAVGATLRDVKLVTGGKEQSLDQVPYDGNEGYFSGYYIRGQYVHLIEPVTTPEVVRLVYIVNPNKQVLAAAATNIASKTDSTITLVTTPSGFGSPLTFDVIHGKEPFDFVHHGFDRVGTLAAGVITYTDGLGTLDMAAGDYVTLPGQTPVVMLPEPVAWLLAQQTAIRCLEGLGDSDGMQAASQVAQTMTRNITNLLTGRVKGDPKVVIASSNPLWNLR